jgi:hypothetical protein
MSFREVRLQILEEHRALRETLVVVEGLCARLEGGDLEAAAVLRDCGRTLYHRFAAHLVLEDHVLLPAIRDIAGEESAEQLVAEHREQRELLGYLLGRLAHPGRPALLLAQELRQFAALLEEDMRHEEETLLRSDGPAVPRSAS